MERQYKSAYASLGEERRQADVPDNVNPVEAVRKRRGRRIVKQNDNASERFWGFRRDDLWIELPKKTVFKNGRRVTMYLVNKILIDLAPTSTFNPRVSWENTKAADKEAANKDAADDKTESAAGGAKSNSKQSIIQSQNELRASKDLYLDVVKIRNKSSSLKNLKDLLPEIRARRSREILLVEILKKALSEAVIDYCEVYDVLWAIEAMGTLTQEPCPATSESSRVLVYDSMSNVNATLKQARSIRSKETNLTSFQLNEMSSRLPPLSRYNFSGGFKLDPWQRQVLEFVDAGKSVVVCAPTSSGKTVLSSYVALIDRRRASSAAAAAASSSSKAIEAADEEDEEDVAEEEEEEEPEEEEEDGEESEEDEEEEGYREEQTYGYKAAVDADLAVDSEHFSLIYDNPKANLLLTNQHAVAHAANRFGVEGMYSSKVRQMDRISRLLLRKKFSDGVQRVLFVVPSEPLVWQVAAYFAKLLREEGDTVGRVGIATNMLTYLPEVKFGTLPQIFVGTPLALESVLTKARGIVGPFEFYNKSAGDIAPGGFDHFDWAVYDEVHSLDGEEGDALQRLIRAMTCKFLALSATVGNAEELRSWFERVKGDQLVGVEEVTVLPADASLYAAARAVEIVEVADKKEKADKKKYEKKAGTEIKITVIRSVGADGARQELNIDKITPKTGVETLMERVYRAVPVNERPPTVESICLRHCGSGLILKNREAALDSLPFYDTKAKEKDVAITFELLTVNATVARAGAADSYDEIRVPHLSPLSSVAELKAVLWNSLSGDEKSGTVADDLCLRLRNAADQAVAVGAPAPSLPLDAEALLETVMTMSPGNPLLFTVNLELLWLKIKAIRTLDFQTATVSHVSPLSSVLSVKEKIVQAWPYFNAESLQLICRYASGGEIQITKAEKVVDSWILTIQCHSADGSALTDSAVLIVGDDLIKIWKVLSSETSASVATVIVRVDHFNNADVSLPLACTASDAVIAGDNKLSLLSYIPYFTAKEAPTAALAPVIYIEIRSLVNLLQHSARFINLQRYVWDGKLKLLSPLAAVKSVESLQNGILEKCNLSFTSRDSYRLWLQLEKLYPTKAVQHLSPNVFFANESRITLQRSKDYEDELKHSLKSLADQYPLETQELLDQFRLEDPAKEFNLCDLMVALKKEDKLPALVFHLNAFDAIGIFRLLISAMERKQKVAHPYYYTKRKTENEQQIEEFKRQQKHEEKVKKEDDDEKETEEEPATIDEYEPHPHFTYCNLPPLTGKEICDLSDEMERLDGFKARDNSAMQGAGKGQNKEVLGHILMRGLRRGVGLFINEVSAPAYRRAVQRLASQGKLAIVVSDDSLAFGVNMPFRTCVFCGQMNGALTPLMAQQMSGRAGRRGLDTEGNLVYAGATASFIRELMIGQVASITGEKYPPKYDTIFLQGLLSPRHTGWNRVEQLGGKTLNEFINGVPLPAESYTLEYSKNVVKELGLVRAIGDRLVPTDYHETLAMVWELRYLPAVSVCMGNLLGQLLEEINAKNKELLVMGREESREARKERLNQYVAFLFSIFVQIFDRVEYDPANSTLPPLQQHAYFADPKRRAVFAKWSAIIRAHQESIPPHLAHLKLPVAVVHRHDVPNTDDASTDPNYVLLDASLFECMLANKQEFMASLNDEQKQRLKTRMWRTGCVLKTMANNLWPRNEYFEVMGDPIHQCFRNLYYLNTELIRYHIKLDDVSAFDRELRTEKDGINFEDRPDLSDDPAKNSMILWKDNDSVDTTQSFPVSFAAAAGTLTRLSSNICLL
jgi:superfamily II DNA or RNA helicase